MLLKSLAFLGLGAALVSAISSNTDTSLTLLYQNNLNASDDKNHISFLILDKTSQKQAPAACAGFGERLLTKADIQSNHEDVTRSLSYTAYAGRAPLSQSYYIDQGVVALGPHSALVFPSLPRIFQPKLPILCTQSNSGSQPATSTSSTTDKISVAAGGNTFTGYRNKKSFRFLGIPYANPAQRWVYPTLYTPVGKTIDATVYGAQCSQGSSASGSEDCLFLNIQTPYLPKKGSKKGLRPVMFWIHGGGFVGGTGADAGSDGGNLASREDIVVVNVNYRLGTLGFLAVPGTNITGNYGIADQILGLEWTVKNIASFGGDPNQITIIGESAGACSVRVLLGSPPAIGKYAGAVAMSNLGGGVTLGISGNYATPYSTYLTPAESYARAGQNIFTAAGCTQSSLDEQIVCLKLAPATKLSLGTARYVVQDGVYVTSATLNVAKRNPGTAHVPVIHGITANDGASFSTYPKTPVANFSAGLQASLGISAAYAQRIIDSRLFPYYDTGNVTLDAYNVSQRIATDTQFRCVDQATAYAASQSDAFPASYFYQMQRTVSGYDPNNLGGPAASPAFPYGNPDLPYFRLHGADMPWVFGTLYTLRNADDLYSIQLTSAYFAAFVKSGRPNPEEAYLRVRGYEKSLEAIRRTGRWEEVKGSKGPVKLLDYPSVTSGFVDVEQCRWLNYSLPYYLEGGK